MRGKSESKNKGMNLKQDKYPTYYFVGATMLIYYFIVKPNSELYEGLVYYALLGLFAWYLYKRVNSPHKGIQEETTENDESLRNRAILRQYQNSVKRAKVKIPPRKMSSKQSQNRAQRDLYIDCECDQCLDGNYEDCEYHNE